MINKKNKLYNQSKARGNFLFRMFSAPFYSNFSRPPNQPQVNKGKRMISSKKASVYLFNIYFFQLYSIRRSTQWKQTIIMCKHSFLSRLTHLRGKFRREMREFAQSGRSFSLYHSQNGRFWWCWCGRDEQENELSMETF